MFALETEKEWLELRKTVVTATEASVLLGQNKYLTPNQMLKEKTEGSFKGNVYTRVGQLLERVVIDEANKKLNRNFLLLEQEGVKVFYKHPDVRLGATPDAVEDEVFLECKTTKELNYLRYKYYPPKNYLMQLQTQLYCAGYDEGYLAIMSTGGYVFKYNMICYTLDELIALDNDHKQKLISETPGSNDITIFHVTKDQRICDILKEEVERFWDTVERKKMFRVNSTVKKEVGLRLEFCYEKVR